VRAARGAVGAHLPVAVAAHRAYLQAVTGGPLDLSPAALGPPEHDPTASPAVEALTARGQDPAGRLARLREVRDDLLDWHPTPYELLCALLEAEAAVALEAARAATGPRTAAGTGPTVVDLRAWTEFPVAAQLRSLIREVVRPALVDREVVALVGPGQDPPAGLADRWEVVPDRLARTRPSVVVSCDVLGASAPAVARLAAAAGCVAVGVVHDLTRWENPTDAADWLRLAARAALLRDLDLVLAADASVAAGLVRWIGLAADRVAVLGDASLAPGDGSVEGPAAPGAAVAVPARPAPGGVRVVHCLASGRAADDVAAVVVAAAQASAGDGSPRRVVVHGPLPPGGDGPLGRLLTDLRQLPGAVEVVTGAPGDRPGDPWSGPPAVMPGDVVVDASHDGRLVRRAVRTAVGSAPVLAVRSAAGLDVLGDGDWLVAPRRHGALAGLLRRLAAHPGTAGEWAAGQHARAREGAARDIDRTAAAVRTLLGSVGPGTGSGGAGPSRGTAVVLSDWSAGPLLDHLLVRAAAPDDRAGPLRLLAARHEPLAAALGTAVGPLDAADLVAVDPVDVLVAVSDSRADAVNVAVAEMYGFPVVTAEGRLFAVHVDTRGPHASVPLVDPDGTLTPHDLVVLRLAGRRPPGSGLAELSRAVRALVVTSEGACRRVVAEGGAAVLRPLGPSAPSGTRAPSRERARAEIGLPPDALVLGSLARGGDPARSAERVIAAAGWLDLWGRPTVVVLPAWTPSADRERLVRLAADLGCELPPVFVADVTEPGVALLVAAVDVLVHLGESDEGEGPEAAWTAGIRGLVTSTRPVEPGGTSARLVSPDITPLLLAEEATAAAATSDPSDPASAGPASAGPGPAAPGGLDDAWAAEVRQLVREAP
jgi:hypothetical protein